MKAKKLLVIVCLLFIICGCGKKEEPVNTNKGSEQSSGEVEEPKKLTIVNLNSTSRPIAVMINNISVARQYQSGLQDAFIIYELIVEGGITRYMALFMDADVSRIGPVRSARHYYLDYVLENDAFYAHHGQSPQAASDITALKVDRILVDNSKTGWRDKSIKAAYEHTLFTSTEKLNSGIGNKRNTRNKDLLLNYSIDEIDLSNYDNAIKADTVKITYSNSTTSGYTYDAENGYYLRDVNGKKHVDYITNDQYHFKNIITYQVKNSLLNDGSKKNRQDIDNIGSGKGYYITNGYAVPITWEKKSRAEQTIYKLENGEKLKVNDGNTFIQIQPSNQKLVIE